MFEELLRSLFAMGNASTASQVIGTQNPYQGDPVKALMLSDAGYGPGMSGLQTSIYDKTIGLTGFPQLAALLSGSGSTDLTPLQIAAQTYRPQATPTPQSGRLSRGNPNVDLMRVAKLMEMAKRKRPSLL